MGEGLGEELAEDAALEGEVVGAEDVPIDLRGIIGGDRLLENQVGLGLEIIDFGGEQFGGLGEMLGGLGVELLLEQREDGVANAIAGVVRRLIGAVFPDGELIVLADLGGIVAGEVQQRAHELDVAGGIDRSLPPQCLQASAAAAACEVVEKGFGPIGGGVAGDDDGIIFGLGAVLETVVAPSSGGGFTDWGRSCGFDRAGNLPLCAERSDVVGIGGGVRSPLMVAMEDAELPLPMGLEIAE
ncbi:MAG: hypothetical protein RLZZ511_3418 [Cyanobacteriota bacterium]